MTIEHRFFTEANLVVSTWLGEIHNAELIPAYKKLYENKNWQPGFNELIDLSQADMERVSGQALEALHNAISHYFKGISFNSAIFAPHDLAFGFARMYEVFTADSPERVMVFRELKAALDWLVDNSQIQRKIEKIINSCLPS